MFLNFHDLSKKEKEFYRDFYPCIETLCKTLEHFIKTNERHEIYMAETLLIEEFKRIRNLEKEIIGEEVNISDLQITDDNYFEVYEKLFFIKVQIEEEFNEILFESMEKSVI